MKIEVLGIGCSKCKKAYANVEQAVKETGIPAEIIKIEKIEDIMKYNVMMLPALIVDGKVKCTGKFLQ